MRMMDGALVLLGAARLTRFVVRDDLAKWWIHEPIDRAMDAYAEREMWAAANVGQEPREPWWWKYRSGLNCPWCVGFWISLGAVAAMRWRIPGVRLGMAGLAVNYLATHAGELLGDYEDDTEEDRDEQRGRDESAVS